MSDLSEAARRAGSIVTAHVDSIVERTERRAEAIIRDAEHDADEVRRDAAAAADRLFGRMEALETPLEELVTSIHQELERAGGRWSVETADEPEDDAGREPHPESTFVEETHTRAEDDDPTADSPRPRDEDDARDGGIGEELAASESQAMVRAVANGAGALADLNEASQRAGAILNEYIDLILERAQHKAETIRREAQRDAAITRRDAVAAAERLLARIEALEFPLGALVVGIRDETERIAGGLESGDHVDSEAEALPSPTSENAPAGERPRPPRDRRDIQRTARRRRFARAAEEEASPSRQDPSARDLASEPNGNEASPGEEPAAPPPRPSRPEPSVTHPDPTDQETSEWEAFDDWGDEPEGPKDDEPKAGLLGRRKAKSSKPALDPAQAHCAVCRRGFDPQVEDESSLMDWQVSADVQLCPTCQADGWQLPEGARLPFRGGPR